MEDVLSKSYKESKPVQKVLILLPGRNSLNWRRIGDFFKRLSFHFQICPRVNLSCFDIDVTEEIPNHVERDPTL